ncbi:MAG: hypothetical protein ACLQME_17830 [Alphaproteobacteria bacterium]
MKVIEFVGSSKESVGDSRLWELGNCLIQRDFGDAEGTEAVRFSHDQFGLVVHTLDAAAGASRKPPPAAPHKKLCVPVCDISGIMLDRALADRKLRPLLEDAARTLASKRRKRAQHKRKRLQSAA